MNQSINKSMDVVVCRGNGSGHGGTVEGEWTKSANDLLPVDGFWSYGKYRTTCQDQVNQYENLLHQLPV